MNDKRTENAMRDRMNWLKGWLKMREYNIGSKRRDFIFVYYCTVVVLYPHDIAVQMAHNRNLNFTEPLGEDMVDSIIEKVDKKGKYNFTNQHIINRLGITEQCRKQKNCESDIIRKNVKKEHAVCSIILSWKLKL